MMRLPLCVWLAAALSACGVDGVCTYGGITYRAGQSFPSSDGCNTCSCAPSGVAACTLRACLSGKCTYAGTDYLAGQSFPSQDGCNTCTCTSTGAVSCTERACAGQCTYDGEQYNPGDTFPSTDGCNTCTCSAGGVVGCTKRACAPSTWLSVLPVQCKGNPWEKGTPQGDGMTPPYAVAELVTIDNFFKDQGIALQELGLVNPVEPGGVCQACMCPRGDRLVVRARAADAATLQDQYGFAPIDPSQPAPPLSYRPRQCNTNPWQPAPGDPLKEAAYVAAWAATLPAPLNEVGFLYPTVVMATCDACSCPRGDRLVAYPKDLSASQALSGRGFKPLLP